MKIIIRLALAVVFFGSVGSTQVNAMLIYDQTIDTGLNLPGADNRTFRPFELSFTFTDAFAPTSDGVLTVTAWGDLNNVIETVEVYAESSSGVFLGSLFDFMTVEDDPVRVTDTLTIPLLDLMDFTSDGLVTFVMVVGETSQTSGVRFEILNLSYAAIPEPSTFGLFAVGLVGLGVMSRRRRKQDQAFS
jgi:hypothetical protein